MPAHSRSTLEKLLRDAEGLVARGAERLRAQEARVAALQCKSALADQSKNLLAVMKQTQELQIQHVALLKQELTASE